MQQKKSLSKINSGVKLFHSISFRLVVFILLTTSLIYFGTILTLIEMYKDQKVDSTVNRSLSKMRFEEKEMAMIAWAVNPYLLRNALKNITRFTEMSVVCFIPASHRQDFGIQDEIRPMCELGATASSELDKTLVDFFQSQDIEHIKGLDEEYLRKRASYKETPLTEPIEDNLIDKLDQIKGTEVTHRVYHEDELMGAIIAKIDTERIKSTIDEPLNRILTLSIVVYLAMIASVYGITTYTLRPLRVMADDIHNTLMDEDMTDKEQALTAFHILSRRQKTKLQDEVSVLREAIIKSSLLTVNFVGQVEARIKKVDRDLERRNQELENSAAELRRTNLELKENTEQLELINRTIYHEFKSGAVHMGHILDDAFCFIDCDTQKAQQFIQEAKDSNTQNKNLILKLSEALGYRYFVPNKKDCDLRAMLDEVWSRECGEERRTSNFTLDFPEPGEVSVFVDEKAFELVLFNLINNSVKYSRDAESRRIKVTAKEYQGWQVIAVMDDGTGFDMMWYDLLFEATRRLHDAWEDFEGSGIGLSIVDRIVHKHHGHSWGLSPVANDQGEIIAKTGLFIALEKTPNRKD